MLLLVVLVLVVLMVAEGCVDWVRGVDWGVAVVLRTVRVLRAAVWRTLR